MTYGRTLLSCTVWGALEKASGSGGNENMRRRASACAQGARVVDRRAVFNMVVREPGRVLAWTVVFCRLRPRDPAAGVAGLGEQRSSRTPSSAALSSVEVGKQGPGTARGKQIRRHQCAPSADAGRLMILDRSLSSAPTRIPAR